MLSERALGVALLHAASNPDAPVLGALAGKPDSASLAIPFAHSQALPSTAQPFLALTASLLQGSSNELLGLYYFQDLVLDKPLASLPDYVKAIAERIAENRPSASAVVVVISNSIFEGLANVAEEKQAAATHGYVFEYAKGKWSERAKLPAVKDQAKVIVAVKEALELRTNKLAQRIVVDFEDHLERPELDWFHSNIDFPLAL